jgi:aconitate hydratase
MSKEFNTKNTFSCNKSQYTFFDLTKLPAKYKIDRLPFSIKILLENLLRNQGDVVQSSDIESILNWDPKAKPSVEIAFGPSRVILQDFTGVPAVVDLATMRQAMHNLGGKPSQINPLSPVELVIDHSVMVDQSGHKLALQRNTAIEFERNRERYEFLRWGQEAFENFKVVPPGTGIVHQVNLEHLAKVTFTKEVNGETIAYPDTLVGTDSHTTMINALGVLGWGVGGIEAEAAMLGQPITMLIPQVIGFELKGKLPEGTTATDLVLTVTQMLRKKGVVGKFVEFYGSGLQQLPLADRATIANMSPEFGATCGIFPIDQETLNYLELSGRSPEQIELVKTYYQKQGMFHTEKSPQAEYTDTLTLDLNSVVPCIAGPKRPQDKILLTEAKKSFANTISQQLSEREDKMDENALNEGAHIIEGEVAIQLGNEKVSLKHGDVVIAAITSCTNTSNPAVMIAAGLIAKAASERGLKPKPWVKTSLAPGSQVVTEYLKAAGLLEHLEAMGFDLVGYGCTTCIGNSGPLEEPISRAIQTGNLSVSAVLSGNRNFEGRIHPQVRNAYLASPPLVVLYALAGTMDINLLEESLGKDKKGNDVKLKDLWPSQATVQEAMLSCIKPEMFKERYASVFEGTEQWKNIEIGKSELYRWDEDSTYVKHAPFFENMPKTPAPIANIENAKVLLKLGDSVTTDHISPAGAIDPKSPAGQYLIDHGIPLHLFNSYGSRRGNHEVMMRGTFANVRLRNQLAPGTEGGITKHQPSDEQMSVFDASARYAKENVPLIVLGGKEYGTGSSRDWAAKGTRLLGVKAVIVESYERIHRSNLIGMGVVPLQFLDGQSVESLGLTGKESYSIDLTSLAPGATLQVKCVDGDIEKQFEVISRIDTPKELDYYKHGGILHYVLRQLAAE